MDDALQNHLSELESLIHEARRDGQIDDGERAAIADLVERVRDDLTVEKEGVVDQLEDQAIRFEANHPSIATAIRSAIHSLSNSGI